MNFAIRLSKNKTFEFDLNYWKNQGTIFSFNIRWSYKGDHAGLNFDLTLFGLSLTLDIHDNRHWNYKENRWEKYPNKEHPEYNDPEPDSKLEQEIYGKGHLCGDDYMRKIDKENDDMVNKL